ncbi:MAG: peptidoglycan-binding protein, partial [Chromatiaceae bacterium]
QAGETIRDTVSGRRFDTVKLPDEEAGLLMVFRAFDRVSFALVMKAVRAIHVLDTVRPPET